MKLFAYLGSLMSVCAFADADRFHILGVTSTQVEEFIGNIQQSLLGQDKTRFAKLVHYPIEFLTWDGKKLFLKTPDEFVEQYDHIVQGELRNTLLELKSESMFANWRGLMGGNGAVWINPFPDTDESGVLRISSLKHLSSEPKERYLARVKENLPNSLRAEFVDELFVCKTEAYTVRVDRIEGGEQDLLRFTRFAVFENLSSSSEPVAIINSASPVSEPDKIPGTQMWFFEFDGKNWSLFDGTNPETLNENARGPHLVIGAGQSTQSYPCLPD